MAQHARRTATGTAVPPPRSDRLPVSFYADGSHTSRLNRLVEICNSVERWLRSGEFLGRQIVKPNPLQTTPEEDASLLGLSEEGSFLRCRVDAKGVPANGGRRTDEKKPKSGRLGHTGLKESLKDLKRLRDAAAEKVGRALRRRVKRPRMCSHARSEPMFFLCQPVIHKRGPNHFGFDGSLLVHQFAQQTCADCDAPVHVLAAVFCASSTSSRPLSRAVPGAHVCGAVSDRLRRAAAQLSALCHVACPF